MYLVQSCCSVGAAGSGHEEVQSVLRVLIYSLADLRHRAYKSVIQSSPVVQNWIVLSIKPPDQITPRAHSRALTRPCEVTPEIRIVRISTSVCFEVEGVTWVYFHWPAVVLTLRVQRGAFCRGKDSFIWSWTVNSLVSWVSSIFIYSLLCFYLNDPASASGPQTQ